MEEAILFSCKNEYHIMMILFSQLDAGQVVLALEGATLCNSDLHTLTGRSFADFVGIRMILVIIIMIIIMTLILILYITGERKQLQLCLATKAVEQ